VDRGVGVSRGRWRWPVPWPWQEFLEQGLESWRHGAVENSRFERLEDLEPHEQAQDTSTQDFTARNSSL